jgi:type IV secretory pathway TraG/TraD family ATPase VirD4
LAFSLPAALYPVEAPSLAAAAIQLVGAEAQRRAKEDEPLRAILVIDEAPRLGGEALRRAVAIGRGAGLGVIPCVQELADLEIIDPGTQSAIETSCATWIVFRQSASAERVSTAIGTATTSAHTRQTQQSLARLPTGLGSEREVERFIIHPNEIRSQGTGEAILFRQSHRGRKRAQRLRTLPNLT